MSRDHSFSLGQEISLARTPRIGETILPCILNEPHAARRLWPPVHLQGNPRQIGYFSYMAGCRDMPVLVLCAPAEKLGLC